jgi:DNA-binding HxlR family transcriptional regulator
VAKVSQFNEIIHAPLRFRICGLLRPVKQLDFAVLRDTLEISDAVLSKHLKTLTEAGYAKIVKGSSSSRADARQLTWASLTPLGQQAFDGHIAALRQMAGL